MPSKVLRILRLLPRLNCGRCGYRTCMVFALKLAEGEEVPEKCPILVEDESYSKKLLELKNILRPPVRTVLIGKPPNSIVIGGKEVLHRHELTWRFPTPIAIDVSDEDSAEAVESRVGFVKQFYYERIGRRLKLDMVALRNSSGRREEFVKTLRRIIELVDVPLIICSLNPRNMEACLEEVGDRRPLIYAATWGNWRKMGFLANKYGCPIVASCPGDPEGLRRLVGALKSACSVDEIVLDPGTLPEADGILYTLGLFTYLRKKAIKGDEFLGYPLLAVPAVVHSGDMGDYASMEEALAASMLLSRYADIMILRSLEKWVHVALLCLRDNLYTDPRKPPIISPRLYEVGKPDATSPLLVTCNYALTFSLVKSDVERGGVDSWILVVDTNGTSVESAVAGGRFTAEKIVKAIKEWGVEEKISHKTIIIPGKAARIASKLRELIPGWTVIVGPKESKDIPLFIKEKWAVIVRGGDGNAAS